MIPSFFHVAKGKLKPFSKKRMLIFCDFFVFLENKKTYITQIAKIPLGFVPFYYVF